MGIFFSWLILSIVVGYVGTDRKIGGTIAFLLSFFLSPLVGLVVTLTSTKNETIAYQEELLKAAQKPKESVTEELSKLHELFTKGVLTQEEYETQKSKILNS